MTGLMDGFRSWAQVGSPGSDDGLELECSVAGPASVEEIQGAWDGEALPAEVLELWAECREAELFADVVYGQWGMRVLTPRRSAEVLDFQKQDRPGDFTAGDIVIAEFLGDLELLVFAPSEEGDRKVMVALELDPRADWYSVGASLREFFQKYLDAQGKKFWEQ
ncbi:hypothetical protein [Streptomyces sp. NPDC101165]|uniref:hypothetical protein n=1 Tax=Streptomyces sp. NPDC101165 TaxID=3366119 RepID=UPI0037F3A9E0